MPLLPRYVNADYRHGIPEKIAREGCCRMCLRTWDVRPPTRHHLVPWRERGRVVWINDPDNIIPLCRPCHDLIDSASPVRAAYRAMLRKRLTEREAAYTRRCFGNGWLNRHYPAHPGTSVVVELG